MKNAILLLAFLAAVPGSPRAQTAESTRKAEELFRQAVAAQGGDACPNLKTSRREGRLYAFQRENLSGFAPVVEYVRYPDKQREEYGKDKDTIQIVSGDKGWTIDIHGAKAMTADEIKQYQEVESMGAFHILRYRLGEDSSVVESGGRDLWDNREVDLVRFIDGQNRTATFSLDRSTHLPVRMVWMRRDPKTRERVEEMEIFSNYSTVSGIAAPRHILRQRNGERVYEAFLQDIRFNLDLPDSLFVPPAK